MKSIAHISAQLQTLASALDKLYEELGDKEIIELIKNDKEK